MIKGIEIIDLGLLLNQEKILVFADFHIGYEEALNKQGILVPRFQFKDVIKRLGKIFSELKKIKIDKIIINGDIKHEFGTISEQEWRETLRLLDFMARQCKEIILVKGNHDTILGPIAKKKKVSVVDYYFAGDILITHGHKIPNKNILKKAKTIVIGHEHPAISLREDVRTEKFKCFLKGKYKRKSLVVMPSFCLATEGTDILKEKLLSPFLNQDLKNFEVSVVADKVYDFGKIKNLL
ncbi:MAG: metallophosphoesterase [Nanoarchaeota archaeon]|nr:metallophosphoesterase [Nanoarchaeota archaeon]MBU4283583.1 metallophosphoesterase [Nanoarchaeota archaeon]